MTTPDLRQPEFSIPPLPRYSFEQGQSVPQVLAAEQAAAPPPSAPEEAIAPPTVSRRSLLKAGVAMTVGPYATEALRLAGLAEEEVRQQYPDIATAYETETHKFRAFARWASLVTDVGPDGNRRALVDAYSDAPCKAGSINKLFIALAALSHVDEGQLSLDQKVAVPNDAADPGEARKLAPVETVGSLLRAMIVDSSNEAFRAIQVALSGHDINTALWDLGFRHTVLEPSDNPRRYFTGKTTPRDVHNLLLGLADSSLVSQESSTLLLNMMLNTTYNAGIRRDLNSGERRYVANKCGRLSDASNEAGIIFKPGPDGTWLPHAVYAYMAETDLPDPLIVATVYAKFGRTMMNTVNRAPSTF